ncbi:MAG: hypothetical protein ACRERE_44000 [Candidatus Entotheonellia bacterium]
MLDATKYKQLRALLHESPHRIGKPRSTWLLCLAAEVRCERSLTPYQVSVKNIRQVLNRLGVDWRRAKQ